MAILFSDSDEFSDFLAAVASDDNEGAIAALCDGGDNDASDDADEIAEFIAIAQGAMNGEVDSAAAPSDEDLEDHELDAIDECVSVLDTLESSEAARVTRYLSDRFDDAL
jgi:hypothetical protein